MRTEAEEVRRVRTLPSEPMPRGLKPLRLVARLVAGDGAPAYPAPAPAGNFDRLAAVYRWMEVLSFGAWLWRCRCTFLDEMRCARRALVLGDGDGRFTARLLRENPRVRVDAMDLSPAMLTALMRRAGVDGARVRALVGDVRDGLPAGDAYDLVVTHFLLDCLTTDEVETLAARVPALTAEDAVWVVSEFAVPAGWFGWMVARPLVAFLYLAFGWMTGLRVRELPDWAGGLQRAGFVRRKRVEWLFGMLVGEIHGQREREAGPSLR